MCLHVPMCPHVVNGLIHNYSLWDWLFIVCSCVCIFPMYLHMANGLSHSNTCCPLWTYLYIYIPMPRVFYGFRLSYNLQYLLSNVNSCVSMCPCALIWPMYWVIATAFNTCCPLWTHSCVCMCPFSPIWPKIRYTTKISETVCSMYTHVSVCDHGPPYGQWFESKLKPSIHDVHCELMCM